MNAVNFDIGKFAALHQSESKLSQQDELVRFEQSTANHLVNGESKGFSEIANTLLLHCRNSCIFNGNELEIDWRRMESVMRYQLKAWLSRKRKGFVYVRRPLSFPDDLVLEATLPFF